MAKARRPRRPAASGGSRDPESNVMTDETETDEMDPLLSLRSRQEEERSCKDHFKSGCQTFFDFTIASCKYSCCQCCYSEKMDEELLDGAQGESVTEVELIKRQLRFHFMNPFEKWKFAPRRRFPCKLLTQLVVIILCTAQLWIVASMKHRLNGYLRKNSQTFSQYFVKDPNCGNTLDPNYYNSAPLAVLYTEKELWEQLNYTARKYFGIKNESIGPYGYGWLDDSLPNEYESLEVPPLNLCVSYYPVGVVEPEGKYYNYSGELTIDCYKIRDTQNQSIREQLGVQNATILNTNLSSVLSIYYNFNISSVYLQHTPDPLCCWFNVTLLMKNMAMSGSMPVYLETDLVVEQCSNESSILIDLADDTSGMVYDVMGLCVLEVTVVVLSLISSYQCVRSLCNSARFSRWIKEFFKKEYCYRLKLAEYLPLYNLWFVLVTFSNLLVVAGTLFEMMILYQLAADDTYNNDIASIVLGLGVFLQWCGVLRFLSYFDRYNMLLITIRVAMPSVLRFTVCVAILYFAFLLLGWLVLGSYHPKFQDPSVTSECLFSLINGDDMFNTFVLMADMPMPAFVFSKIYLYTFISLFIYVVISVFISLISDTYETLHEEWTVRSKGLLRDFAYDRLGRTAHGRPHTPGSQKSDDGYELLVERSGAEINSLMPNGGPLLRRPSSPLHRAPSPLLFVDAEDSPLLGHRFSHPDLLESGRGVPSIRINSTS